MAWSTRTIEVLGGEDSWFFPVLLFSPWEKVLAEEILLVARYGTLALRAAVGLGSQDQAHTELPKHLCPGSTDLPLPVSKVQECADLLWNWGQGLATVTWTLRAGCSSSMGSGMTGHSNNLGPVGRVQ